MKVQDVYAVLFSFIIRFYGVLVQVATKDCECKQKAALVNMVPLIVFT